MATFKAQFSLEKRIEVASKIKSKYPDRVPVIVERAPKSTAPQIDKKKFLVPNDTSVGKFIFEIRKHMQLAPEQGIFLFVNEALPPSASLVSQIYKQHADEDGFLTPFEDLVRALLMEEMVEETPTVKQSQPRKTQRGDVPAETADLMDFVECFKKTGNGKVPKPISRLVEWFVAHEDKMWIVRNADNHLELAYDRPQLIQCFAGASELESARKTVQNFERCLNSVKPKLVVLESTHGKDIKRIGFAAPELIFGTERTVVSQKVERQLSRRTKKQRLDE